MAIYLGLGYLGFLALSQVDLEKPKAPPLHAVYGYLPACAPTVYESRQFVCLKGDDGYALCIGTYHDYKCLGRPM